jgi:hypothetical protein
MRTDCTRDNRRTVCCNSLLLGSSTNVAKRGSWIVFSTFEGSANACGRVLGRVHADGKTWIEVVALLGSDLQCPAIRWVEPEQVRECYSSPPRRIFNFITGDWRDSEAIRARVARGFLSDSYLDAKAND